MENQKNSFNEILESLILLFILDRDDNEKKSIYEECIGKLKDIDIDPNNKGDKIVRGLRKLGIKVDEDNLIEEDELREIPYLFDKDIFQTYKYDQSIEILIYAIELIENDFFKRKIYAELKKKFIHFFSKNALDENSFTLFTLLLYFETKVNKNSLNNEIDLNDFSKEKDFRQFFDVNCNQPKLRKILNYYLDGEYEYLKKKRLNFVNILT